MEMQGRAWLGLSSRANEAVSSNDLHPGKVVSLNPWQGAREEPEQFTLEADPPLNLYHLDKDTYPI